MFQGLQEDQLAGALEAMLFVTDEPVGTIALAEMLECEVGAVEAALVRLRDDLEARGSGIQLREVAGGWRLFTHPAYHELIEKYVLSWDTRKLSAAAMETLAIVAYTQPVTRAGVASVRGVNSDSSINSLVEKGARARGGHRRCARQPGALRHDPRLSGEVRSAQSRRPARFGRLRADAETRRLITERLSATRKDAVVSDEQARTMARALMGEDFEADDGEAMLSDEELAQGTDAAAEVLADALEEERGEEAAAIAAGRAKIEDDEAAEAAGGGADTGAARIAVPGAAADALGTADADAMFARAIASTLGVVDKIDFDSLVFETDDE